MGWTHITTLQPSTANESALKERVEISNKIDKVSTVASSEKDVSTNETEAKEKEGKMVLFKLPHTYAEIVKRKQNIGEINTCSMEPMTKIENVKITNR